ncbi:probable adenylate kinase 7, mitochondrial isoform X3 [Musa acuminata AAA Group]|uniref:probable adenylate kinase 7, mitochondrial isoform X3 n=1 Tax=Musa acuminata AAA Group TaxID=214697 RepID=UPI0031D0D3F3
MSGIHRLGALAARSLAGRAFSPPPMHRRSFGAAALAEVEYWTEWEEEEHGRYAAAAATDACGEREPRRVQWVFMGSPGVQRHVYATRVAELLDVPYISMGSLVRQELNPNSSLYKKEILDQIANIDLVVNLQCRDDCLVKKHFGADICSHCGKTFDSSNSESTSLNLCLATRTRHAQLKSSAAVDMKDSCMEKFRVYSEQIKQLEEYYMKQKKLLDVQVTGGPGETWQGLLAALHLQHMDTATSQKLTV